MPRSVSSENSGFWPISSTASQSPWPGESGVILLAADELNIGNAMTFDNTAEGLSQGSMVIDCQANPEWEV